MATNRVRSKCKNWETCEYGEILWWTEGIANECCTYILHTGEPRGCKIENCDKYKPRKYSRGKESWCKNFKLN